MQANEQRLLLLLLLPLLLLLLHTLLLLIHAQNDVLLPGSACRCCWCCCGYCCCSTCAVGAKVMAKHHRKGKGEAGRTSVAFTHTDSNFCQEEVNRFSLPTSDSTNFQLYCSNADQKLSWPTKKASRKPTNYRVGPNHVFSINLLSVINKCILINLGVKTNLLSVKKHPKEIPKMFKSLFATALTATVIISASPAAAQTAGGFWHEFSEMIHAWPFGAYHPHFTLP
jgi:hypothetical protein